MKISVILAAYNEVEYIDHSIESVVMQKGIDEWELIIGDDGSSDGTLDHIIRWTDMYPNNITYFVMKRPEYTNKIIASVRVSNVLKEGITRATGDYICFLAGDDFYTSDYFLIEHIQLLESLGYAKCVGSMCDYIKYWNENEIIVEKCPHNRRNILKTNIYWGCHMYVHLSAFVFRNIFKSNSIDLGNMSFIDDIGMQFLMGQYGDFCYLPKVMFAYRQREGSIMKENDANDNRISSVLLISYFVKNKLNRHQMANYSRLFGSAKKLLLQHEKLADVKYDKYFELANETDNIIYRWVIRGESSLVRITKIRIKLLLMYFCYLPYRIIKLICYGGGYY